MKKEPCRPNSNSLLIFVGCNEALPGIVFCCIFNENEWPRVNKIYRLLMACRPDSDKIAACSIIAWSTLHRLAYRRLKENAVHTFRATVTCVSGIK